MPQMPYLLLLYRTEYKFYPLIPMQNHRNPQLIFSFIQVTGIGYSTHQSNPYIDFICHLKIVHCYHLFDIESYKHFILYSSCSIGINRVFVTTIHYQEQKVHKPEILFVFSSQENLIYVPADHDTSLL